MHILNKFMQIHFSSIFVSHRPRCEMFVEKFVFTKYLYGTEMKCSYFYMVGFYNFEIAFVIIDEKSISPDPPNVHITTHIELLILNFYERMVERFTFMQENGRILF